MKKIILLTLLCAILVIPLGYSQSFSDGVDTANDQPHSALTTLDSPAFNVTRSIEANNAFNYQAVVTLSQTTTQDFTSGLTCNDGPTAYDTDLFRAFDLEGDYGYSNDFEVLGVEFAAFYFNGVGPNPITVNVYSTPSGTFPGGELTLQGSAVQTVSSGTNFELLTVPVSAIIPAGETLVYEVSFVRDGINRPSFLGNTVGQSAPTYWRSAPCGAPDIVDFGGTFAAVMNVIGQELEPVVSSAFCSEQVPFNFMPPAVSSLSTSVTSSPNSGDLGTIGTGLGQYTLANVTINSISESAESRLYALQSPNGTLLLLDAGNGGTDGLDVATDLVFTDSSLNDINNWTGGPPLADYAPQGGDFASTFAGENINGDWFLIIDSDSSNQVGGTINSFCVSFELSTGNPPTISCIPDFTATNDEGVCGAVVNYTPATAIDGNTGLPIDPAFIVVTGGLPTGSVFPVGDTAVTFTVTDALGNEASCTFNVTVFDEENPVAIADVGVTVFLDEFGEAFLDAESVLSNSTDNCEVTEYLLSNDGIFTCGDIGTLDVEGIVFDEAGNEGTITFGVTVNDDIAPVIECIGEPESITVSHNAENNIEAGYAVACPTGDNLFARRFVLADFGITEEFAFSNGRFGVQSTDLEVDVTVNIWDVSAGFPVGYPGTSNLLGSQVVNVPAGTSNAVISYNFSTPVVVPAGVTTIIVEVSKDGDAAFFLGGTATLADESYIASATCGLADYVTAASINFPDANYYITAKGSFTSSVVVPYEVDLDADGFATILAADLIQGIEEACDFTVSTGTSGACGYDNPNDGSFENGYNCSSTSDFKSANDFIVPADGSFTLTEMTASIFANEGIAGVDVIYHDDANGLPGEVIGEVIGATIVSQEVIGDNFGFDVNEVVLSLPEFTFEGQPGAETSYWIELSVTSGDSSPSVFWVITTSSSIGEPLANFNGGWLFPDPAVDGVMALVGTCDGGGDSFLLDCSNVGTNELEIFVMDSAGNTSSCIATVVVNDVTAPVLVCGPGDGATTVSENFDSLPSGWSLETEIGVWEWTFGAPGAGAAGGTIPFDSNAAIFDDDAAGNGETNRASLLTPVWNMEGVDYVNMNYDYTFNELGAGETLKVDVYDGANWVNIITYDVDQLEPLNSGVIDGTPLANANFQVRWTYDDAGAWGWNAGIDDFEINFAIAPTSSDVTITLDENGEAMVDPYAFLSEGFDACGIDVIVADYEMFTCDDIGAPIVVTVFASDASGNTSSCSVEVVVVDTMGPEFTCPDDQSIMVDPDGTHTVDEYFNGMIVTDNCNADDLGLTQDPAPGTVLGVGVWDITLTATDDYGNSTTCTFELDLTLLGTDDNELNNAISIYPNPANEQVTISNSSNIALETAMIYDLNGKLVSQINLQNMQSEKMIDVSAYATGVYMVYITGEQSSVVKRLIKE
ncbi:HYR domain-containing protein [Flavobacteriaceae bacterium]|nr:HYR domain-containing protein [Flavobacteriaceae bacterium]